VTLALILREPRNAWRIRDEIGDAHVIEGDLAHEDSYAAQVRAFAPTHLVHLAWQGVLGRHRNDSAQYRNVATTMALVEIAFSSGARHFVGLGSQAEYGPCSARIAETAPTSPTTMYGAAKLATCLLAQRFCELNGMRFAWLRLFSSYGPADNPEWMIPYLALKLLRRERPAVTAAEQRWDYVYIDDAAEAVCAVVAHDEASGIFNLGSGTAPPLKEMIEGIRREIDSRLPVGYGEVPYRPDQVMHLEADITRLTANTGWRPRTPLAEGIRKTVSWYREHGQH
jgi:nucleoside-diphosphate-sugar epimerase